MIEQKWMKQKGKEKCKQEDYFKCGKSLFFLNQETCLIKKNIYFEDLQKFPKHIKHSRLNVNCLVFQ